MARLELSERAEVLSEFLWRYTVTFCDLPVMFRDALVAIMEESNPPIERDLRIRFAIALMRDARTEGNDTSFDRWDAVVATEADTEAPERLVAHVIAFDGIV